MPETWSKEKLDRVMFDMVAHEFFHIVTPLNVHSQDVHYFDYNQPTFSKHLWMYEGVTEYFARLFQVDQELISPEAFYGILLDKVKASKGYDDQMSFTEMSEKILGTPYSSNYPNVYQKGALVAMCIDLLMREESDGQRSMLSLMKELSEKYGKNIPFQDDLLIDEITAMTYPSVGKFLKTHVEGSSPIHYQEYFDKVGLVLEDDAIKPVNSPTSSQQNLRNSWLNKKEANVTIIENVNVIPMNEEIVLKNQRVVVANGKIVSISHQSKKTQYKATLTVDGSNKYLIPGLSEMHYHYRNEERDIESEFKLLIANGITTTRNMAAYRWQKVDHAAVKNQISSGEIMGPNYYTAGPYIKLEDLQSFKKVNEIIALHKEKGYDFIKLADNLPKDIYLKLLEEAYINGIDVIGHAQRKLPLEYSFRMKSIEHVEDFIYIFNGDENYSYLNNDIIKLNSVAEQAKISGVYVAPTLVVFDYITQSMDDEKFAMQQKSALVKYLTPAERPEWLTEENPYRKLKSREFDGVPTPKLFRDYLTWMKKFTRILSDHGVPLLTGSDTFGMVIVGFSLHDELQLLTEAGLTPYEALRASTVTPARYLNTIAFEGTVSEGKNANLVLLNKNPLDDISNTQTIDGVMLKGKWFDRNQLDKMLLDVEQLND